MSSALEDQTEVNIRERAGRRKQNRLRRHRIAFWVNRQSNIGPTSFQIPLTLFFFRFVTAIVTTGQSGTTRQKPRKAAKPCRA